MECLYELYNSYQTMLSSVTVCINVLKYITDWRDRENFALTSKAVRALCLSDMKSVPALETDTLRFSSLKKQSVRSVFINESAALTAEDLVNGIKGLMRLEELTFKLALNRRGVRIVVKLLTSLDRPVKVFVLAENYAYFFEKLASVDNRISLFLFSSIDNEDSPSSSEEEQTRVIKRKYDMYETPVDVEIALDKMRDALMKPYVENGLAKLKKHRKSVPAYLRILTKKSIVEISSEYRPLLEDDSFSLNQTCLACQNFNMDTINSYIERHY